jgi:hypothetical protein
LGFRDLPELSIPTKKIRAKIYRRGGEDRKG